MTLLLLGGQGVAGVATADLGFAAPMAGVRTVTGTAAADFGFAAPMLGVRTVVGAAAVDFGFEAPMLGGVPAEVTITNPGTAPYTFRWTLTVTPWSGTVRVSNAADAGEPPLILTGTAAVAELVVNGAARTVTADAVNAPQLVAPGSGWPALVPGDNELTVVGASGTLAYTALYL